jgi:hypothetical protein
MVHSRADLMVANTLEDMGKGRIAFIIGADKSMARIAGAARLARTVAARVVNAKSY